MKDPDLDSFGSQSDSTEYEDDFDFIEEGRKRIGHLFHAKRSKEGTEKSVAELMRRNDLKVLNRLLEKGIEHEERLQSNQHRVEDMLGQLDDLFNFRSDVHKQDEANVNQFTDVEAIIQNVDLKFETFSKETFPSYMGKF